ncbi:hypothetical protein CDO52_01255 [Nocardiopsis gilva YIM 90087]|uniref:DUF218 domain-containing protein n=1 Tax=Nocardiopsis gilva YIM 90087 TaxID=1235441 RepID=A0A223S0E8_9ACTN|nr:YdcF family protein [Nocardiopsis gilva]ASU81603.1 hypothetical protein CDO52_01255 [Nocardiopsis gilva YIM 90087]
MDATDAGHVVAFYANALERACVEIPEPDGSARARGTAPRTLEVRVEPDHGGPPSTVMLLVDDGDLVGYKVADDADSPSAWSADRIRLTVPEGALRDVRNGAATGTATVMSGRVGVDTATVWPELAELRRATLGRRFQRYVAALGGTGHDSAPPTTPHTAQGTDLVAVLAAPNGADGVLSPMATGRTRAASLLSADLGATLVLTGGFGAQFNTTGLPHWRHCLRWLTAQGLLPDRPLVALETRHTYDDALFLRELADTRAIGDITLVTSEYHAERVRYILDLVLPEARVHPVAHPALATAEEARLRAHEAHALGKTVAATVLFGPDRLITPLECAAIDAGERWRPKANG